MRNFCVGVLILLLSLIFITPFVRKDVLAAGNLGVWLQFDETISGGSGSIADSSGNGNNGTPNGATGANNKPQPDTDVPTLSFTNLRSLKFDGTDDYVNVPHSATSDITSMPTVTITAWIKTNTTTGEQGIISKGNETNGVALALIGGKVSCWYPHTALGGQSAVINTGVWYHIACSYTVGSSGTLQVYINGTKVSDNSYNATPIANTSAFLGIGDQYNGYPGRYFNGYIDDVRIYDRVLTPVEVADLAAGNMGPDASAPPAPTPTPTATPTSTNPDNSSNSSPPSSITVCNDSAPSGTPDLFQIDSSGTSAKLYFKTVTGANGYQISYGTSTEANEFGDNFSYSGPLWILDRTINNLSPNTGYYFKVKAVNGCNAGASSRTLASKQSTPAPAPTLKSQGTAPLAEPEIDTETIQEETAKTISQVPVIENLVDKKIEVQKTELNIRPNMISYVVEQGDNLWSIAAKLFGEGKRYADLIALNTETFSQNNKSEDTKLDNSFNLDVGDKLSMDASTIDPDEVAKLFPEHSPQKNGYDLNIKVLADGGAPLSGVKVTLHSTPRESETDHEGIAHFSNVEGGKHQVFIAYNGYSGGGQAVNVTGDNKNLELVMQIKLTDGFSSPKVLAVVIGMGGVIAVLLFLLLKSRRNIIKHPLRKS